MEYAHFDRDVARNQNTFIKILGDGYILTARYLAIKIPSTTNRRWTIYDRVVATIEIPCKTNRKLTYSDREIPRDKINL